MGYFRDLFSKFTAKRKHEKYVRQIQSLPPTELNPIITDSRVSFSHIGLIGDIIYSVPCMRALAEGRDIDLFLDITRDSMYPSEFKHYNENKILTERSVEFIRPLLLRQPGFRSCAILGTEKVHYDLNEFRRYPFDFRMGHIARWYFLAFGVNWDLGKPWLEVNANLNYRNEIIIARSFRYRAPLIDYSFLNAVPNISFIGLKEEFEDMKKTLPDLKFIKVADALQLAEAIAGCKFFIGNQSFPFAVAEALKVPRVLEVSYLTPNVIVEGANGYDFCFQKQFEKIVGHLINRQKER